MKCPHCDGTGEFNAPNVGTMILAARKAARLTQEDLAKKVGLSRTQVTNIEAGRSDMNVTMLKTFAEALGVNAGSLIP